MTRTAPKLVVLRALGLGDLLTGVPALRALRDAFPAHQRLLAAPRALAPLVRMIDPHDPPIHAVLDAAELEELPPHARGADLAVNLHGRGPQSHRLLLATRPRRMLGFRHADVAETAGAPEWVPGEREPARWCRLLVEGGIPADPSRLDLDPPRGRIRSPRGATVIHPGAASGARRWPPDRWAAVARHERARGRPVVLTGGVDEAPVARRIAAAAGLPPESVTAGRTELMDLASLVARAARVVCGDTGVAHLATALGRPSVVLFGPTPPSVWGPPPGRARHRVLWKGGTGDPHAASPDPGLLAITVPEVSAALDEVAGEPPLVAAQATT